jgi:predicted anti-sigma-YlaC factor YlaD
MSCEKYEKLISLYLEKELDEEEEKDMLQHLASCESCSQQLEAIQYMQRMLKQDDRPIEPINKMKRKIYARIYRDLLIMFAGFVIMISGVAVSGGLAQMFLLDQTPSGVRMFFFMGILLLITGIIILMYDIFVDIFKIITRK